MIAVESLLVFVTINNIGINIQPSGSHFSFISTPADVRKIAKIVGLARKKHHLNYYVLRRGPRLPSKATVAKSAHALIALAHGLY